MQVGLLGLGTVGQGVYEIITSVKDNSFRGKQLSIKKILERDLEKADQLGIERDMIASSIDDIVNDDEIDVVISVLGGMEPEYSFIKSALSGGKHVVTSNKEIVSRHLEELLDLAKENQVIFLFEASVGGGIPIIGSLIETLKINQISKVQGILNGTTNYIITKMAKENRTFEDVLAEAQRLGFAEADPSADVDGFDVLRKMCILCSIAFKTIVHEEDVHIRTLRNVTLDDLQMANHYGYELKYFGQAIMKDEQYSVSVTPVLIKKSSVISNVDEEFNIVVIEGNIIGELCFIGKGAGKDATANAVVTDVIKILNADVGNDDITLEEDITSSGIDGISNEYYLRVTTNDYKEFTKAVNLIEEYVKQNKIVYSYGKLYMLTEEIQASDMLKLSDKLKKISTDVFYARLENNLL